MNEDVVPIWRCVRLFHVPWGLKRSKGPDGRWKYETASERAEQQSFRIWPEGFVEGDGASWTVLKV